MATRDCSKEEDRREGEASEAEARAGAQIGEALHVPAHCWPGVMEARPMACGCACIASASVISFS